MTRVMKTKLTLTIEKSIIEKAKELANSSGKSLSEMIENYLSTKIKKAEDEQLEIPKEFQGLFGAIKLPSDFNEKEQIRKILSEKYLK